MNGLELCVEGLSVHSPLKETRMRLHNVSFRLPKSGITLVIGHTGSGKSTLLHVLAGLEAPSAGLVTYNKVPFWTRGRPNSTLLKQLGVVFQYPEHQLFAQTVEREFAYSLKPYKLTQAVAENRIHSALTAVTLSPNVLKQFPLTLSGGQKRRVAIATTFATQPEWLFLDEPTAGLDPEASSQFIATLKDYTLQSSRAVIVATHDLDGFLPIANTVLVLKEGKLLAQTTPEQLIHSPQALDEAGLGLPSFIRLQRKLAEAGVPLHSPSFSMQHMADQLLDIRRQHDAAGTRRSYNPKDFAEVSSPSMQTAQVQPALGVRATQVGSTFDVRAKWLFYILTSMSILVQSHVVGLLAASALTFAVLGLSRLDLRLLGKVLRPFVYLVGLSVLLSGLRFSSGHSGLWHSSIGFSATSAFLTFVQMWKLWLLIMMGVWFSSSSRQLEMKQALEQLLSGLSKIGIPVSAFALGTSLLLRFIPVLNHELQRFTKITQARGKSTVKPGRLRLRELPAFVIPLILSLFQLGEDLALAMEARGCAHLAKRKNSLHLPKLSRRDWGLIALGAALLVLLWVVHSFTFV